MVKRFLTLFAVVLLLFIVPVGVVSVMRDTATRATSGPSGFFVRQTTAVRNFVVNIRQIGTLRTEKEDLQQQVLELQQKLANQENVTRENASLKEELGVTGVTRTTNKLLARIVIQGSDPLDRSFVIDLGNADGIRTGQPAVYRGSLIGRVTEVREHSAVVRSITSQKSRIQAWLADSREKGLLIGDGNTVTLTEITQGVVVTPEGVIETSGLGGSLPEGILIGRIASKSSSESEASQSFRVALNQDPNSLESLFILLIDGEK
jgi:rod shape-determining protein MreC